MSFDKILHVYKQIIDVELRHLFDEQIKQSRGFIQVSNVFLRKFVLRGGKRLRPVLTIMAFKSLCDQDEKKIYLPAVGIELFHNSSLIHDDIMDEDGERRGMFSMHKYFENHFLNEFNDKHYNGGIFNKTSEKFGVSLAILQGNILYALTDRCFTCSAFEAKEVRKALDVVSYTYRLINEGQMLDILSEQKSNTTEQDYLDMVRKKTAHLFLAAVQVGVIFSGSTPQQYEAFSQFAIEIGTAFQLQDDLLDICPGLKGHDLGSDIKKAKSTLLMLKAFENADETQSRTLRRVLGKNSATREEIQTVIDVFNATGAVDYVAEKALQILKRSQTFLDTLELSKEGREFFQGFVDYLAQRRV